MNGIIYYNTGVSYAARLLVSLYSLRKHYAGKISILSWGDKSHTMCAPIATAMNADLIKINPLIAHSNTPQFLAKTKLPQYSPYVNTLYIDADTLIVNRIDELFDIINKWQFVVTSIDGWNTTGKRMHERLNDWSNLFPILVKQAFQYKGVINCGVFGFNKNSPILREWYDTAVKGKDLYVPDEVACQLLITKYRHKLLSDQYNCMFKYCSNKSAKIIHYHARKHTGDNRWLSTYHEVVNKNVANIKSWTPSEDTRLTMYLRRHRR